MPQRESLIDRFVKYTKIETTANQSSKTSPSTPGQLELARIVTEDLKNAGVDKIELQEDGFIYATIRGNLPTSDPASGKVPTIGFLSHLDTAEEAPGKDVNARFIKNYQGGEITFPGNPELKLTTENTPKLKDCIGHTIITSDGTTLLGGDDKAGLAVLVELVHHFKNNPTELHGDIRLAIIPDEEIGVGTEKLDLKKFGADVAYTLDAGEIGEIDVESFNGHMGSIEVEGYAAFPGYGKGVYLNATQVLSKFIAAMGDDKWPQNCAGRQPIWWIQNFEGEVAKAKASVYLRSFDLKDIEELKNILNGIREKILKEFPKAKIKIDINETYKNYKYELEKDPRIVAYAEEAMKSVGITPKHNLLRGGNDSCHLCHNGLLSTNIFIGMQNMHSLAEWNTVETIEGALKTVVAITKVWLEHARGA